MTKDSSISRICYAISLCMGDYPTLYSTPAQVLNHWLFTIGNGIDLDEETDSLIVGGKLVHRYPNFNREKKAKSPKVLARWMEHIEWGANLRGNRGMDKEKFIQESLSQHVFPKIEPEMLSEDGLYSQIKSEEFSPRRLRFLRLSDSLNSKDCEYRYVRPYPLSERYSNVFLLSSKTPIPLLTVAYNFCVAWDRYLTEDLETGRVFEGDSYSNQEHTQRNRDLIRKRSQELKTLIDNKPFV